MLRWPKSWRRLKVPLSAWTSSRPQPDIRNWRVLRADIDHFIMPTTPDFPKRQWHFLCQCLPPKTDCTSIKRGPSDWLLVIYLGYFISTNIPSAFSSLHSCYILQHICYSMHSASRTPGKHFHLSSSSAQWFPLSYSPSVILIYSTALLRLLWSIDDTSTYFLHLDTVCIFGICF